MNKYLVCNVSDQTIPTILFIKEMISNHTIKTIYFTVTEYSKKKNLLKNILAAYPEIEPISETVELPSSDSIKDISKTLDVVFDSKEFSEAHFLVDITCGTKIMSISLYEYFKEFSSEIFYINHQKENYRKIYPGNMREEISVKHRIQLDEYISAYGSTLTKSSEDTHEIDVLFSFFELYKYEKNRKTLSQLRKSYNERNIFTDKISGKQRRVYKYKRPTGKEYRYKHYFDVRNVNGLKEICRKIKISDNFLSIKQIEFLTGVWFEEYIFIHIKKLIKESRHKVILINSVLQIHMENKEF